MKLNVGKGYSKYLLLLLVTFLGIIQMTSSLARGQPENEMSLHHHHQQQHRNRKQEVSRSMERHGHRRRRRHQKDHHQRQQTEEVQCPIVATYFRERAEDIRMIAGRSIEVLEESMPAPYESVCYEEGNLLNTCCRLDDEPKLEQLSAGELQQLVTQQVNPFKVKVQGIVTSYEEHVIRLLENLTSKVTRVLEGEFQLPAKHVNSTVAHLTDNLNVYLENGNVDLSKIVEHFLDSTFALSYYHILHEPTGEASIPSAEHSSCVLSVKNTFPGRSLTTAKFRSSLSFVKTLKSMITSTGEIAKLANKLDLDETCYRLLTKMNYCSKCSGTLSTPPCHWLCTNVFTGCLANYMDLDFHWRDFIQVLTQLTSTTKSHVAVLESFPVKLEEALVHYQLEADQVHAKVSNQCGGHNDTDWRKKNFDDVRESGRLKSMKLNSSEPSIPEFNPGQEKPQSLEQSKGQTLSDEVGFVNEMEKRVKELEGAWPFQNIVDDVCHKLAPQDKLDVHVHCWNGTSVGENSEFERHEIFTSRSPNAAFISELLENNSMIIFKKTMGSVLPFKSFENYAGSGDDDYEDYMSGSGFWDEEFSGDFYEDSNETTIEASTTQSSDFDFTESTSQQSSSSSSSSSSSPSTPPTTRPRSTALPGKPSGAPVTSSSHLSVLLLTSLVAVFIVSRDSVWTLLSFFTSALDWGCVKCRAVSLNSVASLRLFAMKMLKNRLASPAIGLEITES